MPSVSVCFPAYDEEATIEEVLREAHGLLAPSGLDYEILVCNDASSDRTGAIIDRVAAEVPRLRAIHHAGNQGIRATFEHLYAEARKDFVFLNSTDRQWKTAVVFDLLAMTASWDVIVASRKNKHYGLLRRIASAGFNSLPRLVFGVETFDAGSVKLVRREIITRFELVSRSPFTEAERIIRASRAGYRITELPVEVLVRKTGKARGVSLKLAREALGDVVRVWRALRREKNT